MKTVELPTIGAVTQQVEYPDWWQSQPIPIPYFDNTQLIFQINAPETELQADVSQAIGSFMQLSSQDREQTSDYVFHKYSDFAQAFDSNKPTVKISSPIEVWQHLKPTQISVSRRPQDKLIYIQVLLDCDWDQEHGLQLVYKQGQELVRVSSQDGHYTHEDAYGLADTQKKIVS